VKILADLRVLYHMVLSPVRGADHAARLESFYAGQANAYDDFRQRLLHGRQQLWEAIDAPPGGTWVDMGGGTGANLESFGDRISQLSRVLVVDLSPSLLAVAGRRVDQHGWSNVELVEADATTFRPPGEPVDVVTFSYSLTMIPDWFAALENAARILRPGGLIGVVDFYVSRKYPTGKRVRHGWLTRYGWPIWFGTDNVFPSSDHVPYLHRHFEPVCFEEHRAKVPYLPFVRAPYYIFVGRQPISSP
jgi:S-adenosylmethionine-diacylgycerolhomoserine-N-methlytransferase